MRQELLILLLAGEPPRQEDTFWKRGAAVVVCARRMPRDSSLHGAEVRNFLLTLSGSSPRFLSLFSTCSLARAWSLVLMIFVGIWTFEPHLRRIVGEE